MCLTNVLEYHNKMNSLKKFHICEAGMTLLVKNQLSKVNYFFSKNIKFEEYSNSDSDNSSRKPQVSKQKALKRFKTENRQIIYECQQLLTRHLICNNECLNFNLQKYQNQQIYGRNTKIEPLPLIECKHLIQNIINYRLSQKSILSYKTNSRIQKKRITQRCSILTDLQRNQVVILQELGYKCSIIAAILGISTQQARTNKMIIERITSREEIQLSLVEKNWVKYQAKKESNSILFNALSFKNEFIANFPNSNLSTQQFRKILHLLGVRYRIPSMKPLQFFEKSGKNEESKQFISILCGYLTLNYKLIFIDECSLGNISKSSHKQWHVLGSFKQTSHRISSFKYLIGALGLGSFLYFQLFEGTGKAYIFQDFVTSILNKAKDHYKSDQFVLVMDNCSVHKSLQMKQIYTMVPCIFTPAYRPEFNAIEHMFGWIKRKLVISQPSITTQYIYQIHRIISEINDQLIEEWCSSIFKPILQEIQFIE